MNRGPWTSAAVKVAVVMISAIVSYVAAEYVYRAVSITRRFAFLVSAEPLYVFDANVGFRYRPDASPVIRLINSKDEIVKVIATHVNREGHVSRNEDSPEKPVGEYRIA